MVTCYDSDIMGYDIRRPELSSAPLRTKQDTTSIPVNQYISIPVNQYTSISVYQYREKNELTLEDQPDVRTYLHLFLLVTDLEILGVVVLIAKFLLLFLVLVALQPR